MNLSKLKNSIISYFIVGLAIGILIVSFLFKFGREGKFEQVEYKIKIYTVEKVLDGDTLRLSNQKTVRLIGIDTPELHHPEVPVQLFGQEASEFTKQLCEGLRVYLEYDVEKEDKYGRTLAYVYLEDGRMVNEELIKRGYASVLRRFPFKKESSFLKLQKIAQDEQRGLWSYNLSCGRLANIAQKFDILSEEGKEEFDRLLDKMVKKYGQKM